MRKEDFFPMGWLGKRFRRPPYPDMTYKEALVTAEAAAWNINSRHSMEVWEELVGVRTNMFWEHPDYPGRSKQHVAEFNELWRGKVTTLLKWFQTSEGTK